MKNKNLLILILVVSLLIYPMFLYGVFSFVEANWNPFTWCKYVRFWFVVLYLIAQPFVYVLYITHKED